MNHSKTMSPLAAKGLAALQQAVAKLEEDHRRRGEPMAVWRDGKVVMEIPEPVDTLREKQSSYRVGANGTDNTDTKK